MPHWKKLLTFYVVAGAGVAAWAYSKGYAFTPSLLISWPTSFGKISSAPSVTPPTTGARAAIPS
jgi:hypothetical protein